MSFFILNYIQVLQYGNNKLDIKQQLTNELNINCSLKVYEKGVKTTIEYLKYLTCIQAN